MPFRIRRGITAALLAGAVLVAGAPSASATGFLESTAIAYLLKQGIKTTSSILRNTSRFLKNELGNGRRDARSSIQNDYSVSQKMFEKQKASSAQNMYKRDEASRKAFQRDVNEYGKDWKRLGRNIEHSNKITMNDYERKYKQRSADFQTRIKRNANDIAMDGYSKMRGRSMHDTNSRKIRGYSKQTFVRGKR